MPTDDDLAGIRAIQAAQEVQQRRFARARGADDRESLAGVDFEVDGAQNFDRPRGITVALVDAPHRDRDRHEPPLTSTRS